MIYQPPLYRRNYQPDTRAPKGCVGIVKYTNQRAAAAIENRK